MSLFTRIATFFRGSPKLRNKPGGMAWINSEVGNDARADGPEAAAGGVMDRSARPLSGLQQFTRRYLLARDLSQRCPRKEAFISALPLFEVAWEGKAAMDRLYAASVQLQRRAA